ncbi:delta(24)-sterol reductase-like isoform X1 [Limulus polyphemus]|uniref:Delta(24)-sterol reductase n=2 Tax=Limulus polyphemus TaxID=6850 RepID=A0ABM1B201_LIMPO|nr:delta(24)-sterol reductase-like isoform X1 [Limulus polyphemus]
MGNLLENILINYRWIFVCFFLLPLSTIYNVWFYARNWLIFKLGSAPKQHNLRVRDIQRQVKEWRAAGGKTPMCTGRPGWLTMSLRLGQYKKKLHQIYLPLMDVLDIDTSRQIVRVEPLVTMGQLSATLLSQGWTLPVVPELDDLTVGGLINGTGVETSSHIYGLFQHICVSYELILSDGSVVTCTKDNEPDLFYSVPWAHGTLGFLLSAEIRIIPAKKFVHLQYTPTYTLDDFIKKFTYESTRKDPHQFVEALAFGPDRSVLMVADMTDQPDPKKINKIGHYYKPWFYKHVETFLRKGPSEEYIPLQDYFHRHTRSLFWQLQYIIPFGNNQLFRYFLGWLMPPKVSLLKLTQGETIRKLYEEHQFIQDLMIPLNSLKEAIGVLHDTVKIYPIWLCPFLLHADPGMVHPQQDSGQMYVDVGLYGEPQVMGYQAARDTRKMEAYCRKTGGFQMLYADSYMTKDEFCEMFDHQLYDKMREQLNCKSAFPHVYDKVGRKTLL